MKTFIKISLRILFILYLLILTQLILFKHLSLTEIINHFSFNYEHNYWATHNFIPFKTIIFYLFLADINFDIRIENIVGNIIGFIPFGAMLPILSRKYLNLKKIIIATFSLSFTYEVIQLLFKFGSFDIDDLILNTLGGILGYLSIKLIYPMIKPKKKPLLKRGQN